MIDLENKIANSSVTVEDPKVALQALLRKVVRDATRQKQKKNAEVANEIGISGSMFSKILNAHPPIDCDRLVEILEKLNASPAFVRSCLLLATAVNAQGGRCAKYYNEITSWVFSPDTVLADAASPINILGNALRDSGAVADEFVIGHLLEFTKSNGIRALSSADQTSRAILNLISQLSEELPLQIFECLNSLTLGEIAKIHNRYSRAFCVDFSIVDREFSPADGGIANASYEKKHVRTSSIDLVWAKIRKGKSFSDTIHPGIHILVVLRGSGRFAQWGEDQSKQLAFEDGIKMHEENRRTIIFDANVGRHGFQATQDDAEVFVILLKPRLCVDLPELSRSNMD